MPAEPVGEVVEVKREHGMSWLVELFHEADWKPVFKNAFSEYRSSSHPVLSCPSDTTDHV